ncbi:electron transport complex protein RnfC [Balneicella halophila]|uniref:Ion-translocating oxidoreductase complex subunit C n=1 Tax=Balneicella halophila TaxID=1537566 RepID=A0A7L4US34_BALHA|nr:electron transport complex subunit RsxC [Balneicella halophila]PVX52570.1 electron transport complex protein RnfC [Balneicella halophila]
MLKTFSLGGIHPPENKLSARKGLKDLPLPKMVTIPVSQHIGAPAKILVKRGEEVKVGQLIAESAGFISANIYASVSGKVKKIDQVVDASGYRKESIVISVEGDEWLDTIDRSDILNKTIELSPQEIIDKVAEAGIVGLGGATFPAHVKLMVPPGKKAEVLIVNGVECEPYLTSDHQLMLERGEQVIVGVQIVLKALGIDKAIIGIENNKEDAIKHLRMITKNHPNIKICPLKVQYPQGGEKQLIKATIDKEVPSGALPIEVGAVVQNVATIFAIYEAVQKNKPLISRIVTVTGKSFSNPSNWRCRIGIPISHLIEQAGGLPEDTEKVISGGPMMGKALTNLDAPITKGTSGVLLIRSLEARRKEMQNCIRCCKCVRVCPMGLEPYLLMQLTERNYHDRLEKEDVMDCIECGSCSYTCPSYRPLLDYIRIGKKDVGQIMRSRKK